MIPVRPLNRKHVAYINNGIWRSNGMKTKFEANVATQIPKTKVPYEPRLPWEVSSYGLEAPLSLEDTTKVMTTRGAPFGTRPVFLIILLISVFAATSYVFVRLALENRETRLNIRKNEQMVSSLQTNVSALQSNLEKTAYEKDTQKNKANRLEKEIGDLKAQNEGFRSVLENISIDNKKAPSPRRR